MSYKSIYPWQILTRLACLDFAYKLPFAYDQQMLRDDLKKVLASFKMARHFREDHHDGGWNAVGLFTADGDPQNLGIGETYSKTPVLKYAPYVEHILDNLPSRKQRVRLMRLEKKKNIFWHYDAGESMDGRVARLHIPVVTNENVEFQICHQDMRWRAGELWYGDFSFPHRLRNGGEEDRVHLVIDLVIDEFLWDIFPEHMKAQTSRRKHIRPWAQHLCKAYTKAPNLRRYFGGVLLAGYGRLLLQFSDDLLQFSDDLIRVSDDLIQFSDDLSRLL